MKLSDFGQVIMGMSPSGETYNEKGEGLPLLNGPTEFTSTCPIPKLYTTDSKRECKVGDLFFCVRGSTTGKMNWADQVFSIGRGVCAIRGKNTIDTKYIKYCIEQNLSGLLAIAGGGTFPNLKKDDIGNFEIPIINNRQRIVEVLSAYDDLIENNLKRIKLLEETAQNIYKEWFVNFRFPNYEHIGFDTESGLPVGWKKKSLNNFDCVYQFKEKVKPYIGEKEYLATANIEGINISERGEYFTFENRPSRAQHLAPQESVWFARMSKTYKVILFTKSSNSDILLSSGFVGFIPKKSQFLPFLFCLINNKLFFDTKDMFCTGSTQVSLNNESINKLIYVEPNEEIITEFGNKVYPLIEQINKLFELNQKLKEARDILLPRLMNRTIEV
jgi:type I restriction enzyme S subunit